VAAACVGPHPRERDFGGGALLQQQPAARVEQEDGKGAVQQAARLAGDKAVRLALAGVPHYRVGLVDQDALVLEHQLLLAGLALPALLRGHRGGGGGGGGAGPGAEARCSRAADGVGAVQRGSCGGECLGKGLSTHRRSSQGGGWGQGER
jgi:hypothetical protein